jgi:hypothetical protein
MTVQISTHFAPLLQLFDENEYLDAVMDELYEVEVGEGGHLLFQTSR